MVDTPRSRSSHRFSVSVSKDDLVFSSAHFITLSGHRCEGLHGHNYRARVTVTGALEEDSWFVFDFIELKRLMRALCDRLDHLVLLPLESSRIVVSVDAGVVSVAVDNEPRYLFPSRDCALLPLPNTTVEMLARYLAEQLRGELEQSGACGLTSIDMEIEENFGQSAACSLTLG